jgi:hypothetical protein
MNKILLALLICVFSVSAMACGGSKDGEEEKRFDTLVSRPV